MIQRLSMSLIPAYLKTTLSLPPWTVNLIPTFNCDYHCVYCSNRNIEAAIRTKDLPGEWAHDMSPEIWNRVIRLFRHIKPIINIFGGEPLRYPLLSDMIRLFSMNDYFISLTTNGRHLEEHADMLVANNLPVLGVSYDGCASTYTHVSGDPAAHDKTIRGLHAVQRHKQEAGSAYPIIKTILVINSVNFTSIAETVREMVLSKPDLIAVRHLIFNTPDHLKAMTRLSCSIPSRVPFAFGGLEGAVNWTKINGETVFQQLQEAKDIARHAGIPFVEEPGYSRDQITGYYSNDPDWSLPNRSCHVPWNIMNVFPNGDTVFCGLYFFHVYGNILRQPLHSLWNGKSIRKLRRTLLDESPYHVCERCCARSI